MDLIDRLIRYQEVIQQLIESGERVLETASFPVGSMAAKDRLEEAVKEGKEVLADD